MPINNSQSNYKNSINILNSNTMQRQKLTTLDKLKYVSRAIDQRCMLHQKQTRYYCSKSQCLQYSYLCQRCFRQNAHGHIDQIQDFQKWTDKMIQKINEYKLNQNHIFQSQYNKNSNKADFTRFLTQLRRVLSLIQNLQARLAQVIMQSKGKIIGYIRKYQNYGESRLASKIQLYTNPYILINKINSERNDGFIQELKKTLRGQSVEILDSFNPKYELITLQNKVKAIAAGSSNQIFNLPKQVVKSPEVLQSQKCAIICEGRPQNLFSNQDTVLVNVKNQTHIYSSKTQKFQERLQISISKCSSLIIQNIHSFIGISNSNNKEMLSYINKVAQSFSFQFKICSILLYYSNSKFYAIIGREEGKLSIFDLQKKSIIATLQESHNSKIQFLRYWNQGQKILCSGKNTQISRYSLTQLSNEITLQYQQLIPLSVMQINQLLVYSSYIIVLTKGRNFYIYDMVLKLQFKTNYKDICKEFDMGSIISQSQNHLILVTHNIGQSYLHLCTIQKQRPDNIIMQKINFFNREELIFLELNGNDVWFIRPQESDLKVYNYNLIIA